MVLASDYVCKNFDLIRFPKLGFLYRSLFRELIKFYADSNRLNFYSLINRNHERNEFKRHEFCWWYQPLITFAKLGFFYQSLFRELIKFYADLNTNRLNFYSLTNHNYERINECHDLKATEELC